MSRGASTSGSTGRPARHLRRRLVRRGNDAALADLDLYGYNTVRVFVGGASLADASALTTSRTPTWAMSSTSWSKAARGIQVIVVAGPPGRAYAVQVAGGAATELAGENATT